MAPENKEKREGASTDRFARPMARDWLWRPAYAKLWWIGICIFYLWSLFESSVSPSGYNPVKEKFAFLSIVLSPQAALFVLGFPFLRAWLNYRRISTQSDVPTLSVKTPQEFLSDPADPMSPLNPSNHASPLYRMRHRH